MKILIFFLLLYVPQSSTQTETEIEVDKIVLNHILNNKGEIGLSQYILYKHQFLASGRGMRVQDWFLKKENQHYLSGGYYKIYCSKDGKQYILKTKNFKEITSNYDPELLDRNILPENNRESYFR